MTQALLTFEQPKDTHMLDARYVADHLDEVRAQLARRGSEFAQALDGVLSLVTSRRELTRKTELLQGERNTASDAMAKLAKSGDKEGMAARRDELKALSERVKALEIELAGLETQIEDVLLGIPNVPHDSVPDGQTEDKNVVVRTWGEKPSFAFEPKPHYELGEKLGILDFERAANLSGRASRCCGAWARGWSAPWPRSCSTCIPVSTATPRCIRRTWSRPRPCAGQANYQNSKRTCSRPSAAIRMIRARST